MVVINETLAKQFFGARDPVGHRLKVQGAWRTIVGVVSDVKSVSLESDIRPQVYRPHAQDPWPPMTVVLHIEGNPLALTSAVRGEVKALDGQLPVAKMRTTEQVMPNATGPRRFNIALLAFFAVAALLLTMMGIYGVVAFLVGRRSREIGIRMALGAQIADVMRLILGQGLVLAAVGGVIGIAVALATGRLLRAYLFGVSSTDPLTFIAIVLLLAAVALFACWLPAQRAARVDPVVALRAE